MALAVAELEDLRDGQLGGGPGHRFIDPQRLIQASRSERHARGQHQGQGRRGGPR
jgi:hypothetical protein